MLISVSQSLAELHDGVVASFQQVVPIDSSSKEPSIFQGNVVLDFGVLIGITGDIKGKILYKGKEHLFGLMAERMYGMALEGDMLHSFVGELGNMVSGRLCTNISTHGKTIDITAPTVMSGSCKISGFNEALEIVVSFQELGNLMVYILLDEIKGE